MRDLLYVILFAAFTARVTLAADDIDIKIPVNSVCDEKTFVLIIANENYKHTGKVAYARNDGDIISLYFEKTLGIPKKHIHYVNDATLNDINHELQWLVNIVNAYKGEARAIFYYSGHGMPDESSKDALLLPTDGYATDAGSALGIKKIYEILSKMSSRQTLVFMDACFSGMRRDGSSLIDAARGVAIKTRQESLNVENIMAFSAAKGEETAYPYEEKRHGLFTYYLLKKLQTTGGKVTVGELCDYVIEQVSINSLKENGKQQTPTVTAYDKEWRAWQMALNRANKMEYRSAQSDIIVPDNNQPKKEKDKAYKKTDLSSVPIQMPEYQIEGAGTGVQGTYLVKVTVTDKNAKSISDDQLMRAAIHGVLFRGVSSQKNRQHQRPLAGDASLEQQQAAFFNDFFTSDFRNYAYLDSESRTIIKANKKYEVTNVVSVKKDQLRKYLVSQGIIKGISYGL